MSEVHQENWEGHFASLLAVESVNQAKTFMLNLIDCSTTDAVSIPLMQCPGKDCELLVLLEHARASCL